MLLPRSASRRAGVAAALGGAALAIAPDFDFLAVLLAGGHRSTLHRSATHSLLAVVAAGILIGPALAALCAITARRGRWLAALSWASHLLLDLLSPDARPPAGVQLFWPGSRAWVAPWPVLPEVDLSRALAGDGEGLVAGLVFEILSLGGAVAAVISARALLGRAPEVDPPA